MIVVAVHDNVDFFLSMANRLLNMDLAGHDVLFVDTNSESNEFLNVFDAFAESVSRPDFSFLKKDYSCWDSGAYIHAYKNFDDSKYIFLQDSIEIVDNNFFRIMNDKLDEFDIVPVFNFNYRYDSESQRKWVENGIDAETPSDGIFGPIFGVKREALDRLPKNWFVEPSNKEQACGMERRWSLMFHATGASKFYLNQLPHPFSKNLVDNNTSLIKKLWGSRK